MTASSSLVLQSTVPTYTARQRRGKAKTGQEKTRQRQGKAGRGQDTTVLPSLLTGLELEQEIESSRTKYLPGTHVVPHSTCRCGLFYGLLLVLAVSTASAQTPSLINQDCRPCSHQNSEPPSIERHRHLIFFFCQLLLESSPKLTGIPSLLFFLFLLRPIHSRLSLSSIVPSNALGPRRLRRN
ncbi:hypothetical protein J3F84DRAFT_369886 [Trichoderma pleuroticola]